MWVLTRNKGCEKIRVMNNKFLDKFWTGELIWDGEGIHLHEWAYYPRGLTKEEHVDPECLWAYDTICLNCKQRK